MIIFLVLGATCFTSHLEVEEEYVVRLGLHDEGQRRTHQRRVREELGLGR